VSSGGPTVPGSTLIFTNPTLFAGAPFAVGSPTVTAVDD
jgi:hypothetical protein